MLYRHNAGNVYKRGIMTNIYENREEFSKEFKDFKKNCQYLKENYLLIIDIEQGLDDNDPNKFELQSFLFNMRTFLPQLSLLGTTLETRRIDLLKAEASFLYNSYKNATKGLSSGQLLEMNYNNFELKDEDKEKYLEKYSPNWQDIRNSLELTTLVLDEYLKQADELKASIKAASKKSQVRLRNPYSRSKP